MFANYPSGGAAVHGGTTKGVLDISQGLISALGGEIVHGLEFVGDEIVPLQSGSSMVLEDGYSPFATWASHPAGIGYRRAGSSSGGSGSSGGGGAASAVYPQMDSGLAQGSTQDELEGITNLYTGADENPTSAQSRRRPARKTTYRICSRPAIRPWCRLPLMHRMMVVITRWSPPPTVCKLMAGTRSRLLATDRAGWRRCRSPGHELEPY